MRKATPWAKRGLMLLTMAMLHACVTQYATIPVASTAIGENVARHGLRDDFLRDPPACVIVLPVKKPGTPLRAARYVEASVERFLAIRFDRVLAGSHRDRQVRHLALDLARPADLQVFAKNLDCHHAMTVTLGGGGLSYAVIWAERRVGLDLRLTRIGDLASPLWWARDEGARGDGGLPFSPLGVASALLRAGRVAGDDDQERSLLDDVLRRMTRSLPDVRGLAYSGANSGANSGAYSARLSMNSTVIPSGSRK
jgi:hypothetical protein